MCFECARTSSGGQVLLGAHVPCWSLHILASLFLSFLRDQWFPQFCILCSFSHDFYVLLPEAEAEDSKRCWLGDGACWVHASQRKILILCFCRVLYSFPKHCILMTIFHPNRPRKKFSPNSFHLIRKLRHREVMSPRSLNLSRVVLGLELGHLTLGSRLLTLFSWVSS